MLDAVKEVLVAALRAPDPPAALAAAQDDDRLSSEERAALAALDPDALRLTRLVLAKLRFERLLQGDPRLRAEFAADPAGFTARFRRYDQEVPPTTCWPAEEAAAFRAFSASAG